jgi:hypothetical protein
MPTSKHGLVLALVLALLGPAVHGFMAGSPWKTSPRVAVEPRGVSLVPLSPDSRQGASLAEKLYFQVRNAASYLSR